MYVRRRKKNLCHTDLDLRLRLKQEFYHKMLTVLINRVKYVNTSHRWLLLELDHTLDR